MRMLKTQVDGSTRKGIAFEAQVKLGGMFHAVAIPTWTCRECLDSTSFQHPVLHKHLIRFIRLPTNIGANLRSNMINQAKEVAFTDGIAITSPSMYHKRSWSKRYIVYGLHQ